MRADWPEVELRAKIELEALISERQGMDAENQHRGACGHSPAYGMDHYQENAERIRAIARDLEEKR